MNANIPFEYVTPDDLTNGLADRYQVIYLPSIISLRRDILDILDGYVRRGGRLVLDLPSGKFDENTAILPTGTGSVFANVFGLTLDNFQFSGSNKTLSLMDREWTAFVADMTPVKAVAKEYYSNGKAAITENTYGKGTAVIIGLDIAQQCFSPGNVVAEQILVSHTLGESIRSPYTCENAVVYRRAGKAADHYFFISDGPARTVSFYSDIRYSSATDALTGETVDLSAIRLDADDARWIRMEK
jgi:beta-galactosidase